MFARSFGLIPVTVLMRISIPSPSGYCGAWRSIRHSGNTNAPRSITVATASSVLESFVTESSRQMEGGTGGLPAGTAADAIPAGPRIGQLPPLAGPLASLPPATWALALALMFATSGTFDPVGETRTYPDISWCSAEQKSVQ